MYDCDCDKAGLEGDIVAEYGPLRRCKCVDVTSVGGRPMLSVMMTVCRWVGG